MNEVHFDEQPSSSPRAGTLYRLVVAGITVVVSVIAIAWYVHTFTPSPSSAPNVLLTSTPLPTWTPSPTPVAPTVYTALAQRPYRFPTVYAIATCPTSPVIVPTPGPDLSGAIGKGPILITVLSNDDGTVVFSPAGQWGDGIPFGGTPTAFWLAAPGFAGPYLARGMRLDAPGVVTFVGGDLALTGTLTAAAETPMRAYQIVGNWYIRFQDHGCYGIQIDTLETTEVIIFRA